MDPTDASTPSSRFTRVQRTKRPRPTRATESALSEPNADVVGSQPAPSVDGETPRPSTSRVAPRGAFAPSGRVAYDDTPTLADHWAVLRRRWGIVAGCVVVAVLLAGLWLLVRPTEYVSEATVVIRPIGQQAFSDARIEDVGASTEAAVVGSTVVADIVARRTNQPPSAVADLRSRVTVTNPDGTLLLRIGFTGDTARQAQVGAQAFAEAYLEHRRATAETIRNRAVELATARRTALETDLAAAVAAVNSSPIGSEARAAAEVTRDGILSRIADINTASAALEEVVTEPGQIIRPADLPTSPDGLPAFVIVLGAAMLGALIGAVIAFVRDRTDPRITTRRSMVAITGAEPLAVVPEIAADTTPALADPEGRVAGSLRRLRVAVWPQRGDGPQRLVVTSPTSVAAADAVAGNLAVTLALAGWSTLLAWTERDPAAGGDQGALEGFGSSRSGSPVAGALGLGSLTVLALPVGSNATGTPAERLCARLDALGGVHDVEIIAAPALMRGADALEASPLSDAMLVVVDLGAETRDDLDASVEALDAVGAPVEGIVAYRVPKGW